MRKSQYVIQQRQQDLLALLTKNGRMLVGDLSERLAVSEITVRRDLELLARTGAVERFHGGGMIPCTVPAPSPHFEEKAELNVQEKILIAKTVAGLIKDGVTVTLNAGSTTLGIIKELKDKSIRMVTNNAMASAIIQESPAELICTGGEYNGLTRSFTGEFASHSLNKMNSDICILGANGVDAGSGVTSSVYKETFLNELMVNRCRGKVIIAADGSKIGMVHCFVSVPIEKVHMLVTTASANPEALDALRAAGVQVLVAEEQGE